MPKDACYRKVKARYRVFPSAYASGAIAKCRKVGAANYGTGGKKKKKAEKKKKLSSSNSGAAMLGDSGERIDGIKESTIFIRINLTFCIFELHTRN